MNKQTQQNLTRKIEKQEDKIKLDFHIESVKENGHHTILAQNKFTQIPKSRLRFYTKYVWIYLSSLVNEIQLFKQDNGNKSYRDVKKVSHTLIKKTQKNLTIKVKL